MTATLSTLSPSLAQCLRCDSNGAGKSTGHISHFSHVAAGVCFCCFGSGVVEPAKIKVRGNLRVEYYTNPDGDRFLALVSYSSDFRHRTIVTSFFIPKDGTNAAARLFWKELLNAGFTIEGHDCDGPTGKTWKR
jgi:hypothetical protein